MMALLLFTLSGLLFYSTSKYFPFSIPKELSGYRSIRNTVAAIFVVLGIVLLGQGMDVATSIVAALVMIMTLIPLLVLSLSAYPGSWVGWVIAIIIMAIIDLFQYAG